MNPAERSLEHIELKVLNPDGRGFVITIRAKVARALRLLITFIKAIDVTRYDARQRKLDDA